MKNDGIECAVLSNTIQEIGRTQSLFDLEGTIRITPPEQTWEKLQPLLAPAGITRVADVTGLDAIGTPTFMVVRPLSRSLSVSQGKGLTPLLAKISGVMESMEAFHAENFVPDCITLPLEQSNTQSGFMDIIGLPLRPELHVNSINSIHWIKGQALLGNCEYVPRELVDLDFTLSNPWRQHIFAPSSNGLAAGNSENEALVHALCEICERDQIAFSLMRKQLKLDDKTTRVDLDTIDDEIIASLIHNCQRAGVELAIWDCRTDLNIPCFICAIHDAKGNSFYRSRASGSGCHVNKRIAILRAISEAFQSRLTNIAGSRDDKFWQHYAEDLNMDFSMSQKWLTELADERADVNWNEIPDAQQQVKLLSMQDIVHWLIGRLGAIGIENVVKINLSNDLFNIPVVKVVAQGAEQNIKTPGYSPGPRMQEFIAPHIDKLQAVMTE